jgi:hypothetical protein
LEISHRDGSNHHTRSQRLQKKTHLTICDTFD